MLKLVSPVGRAYNIKFVHSSPFDKEGVATTRDDAGKLRQQLDNDATVIGRRITLCEIQEVTNGDFKVLGQGIAICHPTDVFKKPEGRKISLTYALDAAGLDKTERRAVWTALRVRFGDSR